MLPIAVIVVLLVIAELYARFGLGLGDPPLYRADPEIEYLALPSRTHKRFGNIISYNAHSMRSREFPARKQDPAERRVLVLGDSIVNGGAQTDQADLATTLLEARLAAALDCPVVLANVSASSWGPPNYLAYVKRFGLFDADVVVIVVNSDDYADAPTFEPLDDRRPRRKPLSAFVELVDRSVRQRLRRRRNRKISQQPVCAEATRACMGALRELIDMGRAEGASVLLAQHLTQDELEREPQQGHCEIARVADEMGLTPLALGPAFEESSAIIAVCIVDNVINLIGCFITRIICTANEVIRIWCGSCLAV